MPSVNKVILVGRVGRDPKLIDKGTKIVHFSLATEQYSKNGNATTEWHSLTAFNKYAETIARLVKKGTLLYVEGRLHYSQWAAEGKVHSQTEIIVDSFQFLSSRESQKDNGAKEQNAHKNENNEKKPPISDWPDKDEDDDIPF